jgi:ribosomal protein S27AE
MVIERIKDSMGGSSGPKMETSRSTCPKCGEESHVTEYEVVDGELILDDLYCERGCQI